MELSPDATTLTLCPRGSALRFQFRESLSGRTSVKQWHDLLESVLANSEAFSQLKLNACSYKYFKIRRISQP